MRTLAKAAPLPVMAAALLLLAPVTAGAHPVQHPAGTGHLHGTGAWGELDFVGKVDLTDTDDLIADVAVDPRHTHAYLAHWGNADCDANSEAGGVNDADAGIFVVDISDLSAPRKIGFIPHSQDSRPGEGTQVIRLTTKHFDGYMLVANNEQCGKNGKGGVTLIDVTNPAKPYKLSEHFGDRGHGDVNDIHSAFAWDTGDNAYVVMTDNAEAKDVDILDISNPKRPRLIADLNLNAMSAAAGNPIDQPAEGLQESFLHDMVVKRIGGRWIMLLSYWDGGYVKLDVTNPTAPTILGDTDYQATDPELAGTPFAAQAPEGNGHQAEFTADDKFFVATDEDFAPYDVPFLITTGPNAGEYPGGEFSWTKPIVSLPDKQVNGPTVFGGYGCPGDRASIPPATAAIPAIGPGEERIVVFSRGPSGDPAASGEACFFSEKVESAQLAGYDAVVVANHHSGASGGAAADAEACGSMGHSFTVTIPGMCIGHRAMHLLFNSAPAYQVPYVAGTEPAVGALGERISAKAIFNGWGYVHLYDATTLAELDTYAIDEAHDPAYASGYGDLSVHEVATDPAHPRRAYLSYYGGGMRAIDIVCANEADTSTCELVEVGGYLAPHGNDFWGVEAFVRGGTTYVLGSDRDDGLWVFKRD